MIRRSLRTGLPLIPKAPPERSDRCTESPPAALLAGIAQFNAGEYWHCHETLEALWRGEPDPVRSLYQGILLVGVGYYHLQRGNARGGLTKRRQGVECLEPFRPTCMGIAVGDLADDAVLAVHEIGKGPWPIAGGIEPKRLPQIRFVAPEGV